MIIEYNVEHRTHKKYEENIEGHNVTLNLINIFFSHIILCSSSNKKIIFRYRLS